MDRVTGRVKWFSAEKGYGFLEWEGGTDVFVHRSSIDADGLARLTPGDRVEFEIVSSQKGRGPRA